MPVEIIYASIGFTGVSFAIAVVAFFSARKKQVLAEDDRVDGKIKEEIKEHEEHCVGLVKVETELESIKGWVKEINTDVKKLLARIPAKE